MLEDNRELTNDLENNDTAEQNAKEEEKRQRVRPVGDVRGISIETLKRGLDERLSEKEEDAGKIRGISISNFAYVFLFSIMLFTLLTTISMINVSDKYHNMLNASGGYNEARDNVDMLRSGSDYLTEEVRQFVITGDKTYMDNYFEEVNVTMRRDKAVDGLSANPDISRDTVNKLVAALNMSNKLKAIECHAMHLTAYLNGIPDRVLESDVLAYQITDEEFAMSEFELAKRSYELVFGDEYMRTKEQIMAGLEEALDGVENDTGTEVELTSSVLQRTLTVQIILTLLVLIVIIIGVANMHTLIIRPVKNMDERIKAGDNLDLEGTIELQSMAHAYNTIFEQNNMRKDLLSYKAEHDELTQLLNRNAFEKITYKLKDLTTPMVLLIMDIDKFSAINNRYGHSVGDESLKLVSAVLQKYFRDKDYCVRFGGDEFVVLMTDISESASHIVSNKIKMINEELRTHGVSGIPVISLSVGVAFSEEGYSELLFEQADKALLFTKNGGRSGYTFFGEPNMEYQKT